MEETECEIEVIEENKNYLNDISKLIIIKETEVDNQQIVINGIPVINKVFVLCCPKCGKIIQVFNQPGLSRVDVSKYCRENIKQLEKQFTYCPNCGQKLSYNHEIVE